MVDSGVTHNFISWVQQRNLNKGQKGRNEGFGVIPSYGNVNLGYGKCRNEMLDLGVVKDISIGDIILRWNGKKIWARYL